MITRACLLCEGVTRLLGRRYLTQTSFTYLETDGVGYKPPAQQAPALGFKTCTFSKRGLRTPDAARRPPPAGSGWSSGPSEGIPPRSPVLPRTCAGYRPANNQSRSKVAHCEIEGTTSRFDFPRRSMPQGVSFDDTSVAWRSRPRPPRRRQTARLPAGSHRWTQGHTHRQRQERTKGFDLPAHRRSALPSPQRGRRGSEHPHREPSQSCAPDRDYRL